MWKQYKLTHENPQFWIWVGDPNFGAVYSDYTANFSNVSTEETNLARVHRQTHVRSETRAHNEWHDMER
jgi:hypothetical protein